MKTAIILFGNTSNNPEMFLTLCGKKLEKDGYTVLHSLRWDDYKHIDMKEFIEKTETVIDTFYLFIDYGVTQIMADVNRRYYYKDELGIHFTKEIKIDLGYNGRAKTIEDILRDVSDVTKIPVELMISCSRKREVTEARQFYYKRAKLLTKNSLASIGALVNRGHATTIYGIKVVDNVMEVNDKYELLFNGKKRVKKAVTEASIETKDLLIGRGQAKAFISPFEFIRSEIIKPYSGYRVHSM